MASYTGSITQENALIGRDHAVSIPEPHFVNQTNLTTGIVGSQQQIIVGMGCFWGAERLFWQLDGVISTAVGYCGGFTPNPTYEEVCSGNTGHAEVVKIIFNPEVLSLNALLEVFWQRHDPTQGMRQGNDLGTQYRSALYTSNEEQQQICLQTQQHYQQALAAQNMNLITTEITLAHHFYFAENYHQQYLAKNPNGYCGLGGTGVCFVS